MAFAASGQTDKGLFISTCSRRSSRQSSGLDQATVRRRLGRRRNGTTVSAMMSRRNGPS
jgi:hypothetical protein